MALRKRVYTDEETTITADNLNEIQDAVIALEDGLFSVDNNKNGEIITITDAAKRGFRSLNIYGKTTQDGTPTPEAPVELVSVGDSGSITVNVIGENQAQSMTISTPNGLPGFPVESGGNYIDGNGQNWICDERDFAKGVYIQRIGRKRIEADSELTRQSPDHTVTLSIYIPCTEWGASEKYYQTTLLCTIATPGAAGSTNDTKPNVCRFNATFSNFLLDVSLSEYPSIEAFRSYITEHPFHVYYILATPIETPLSEEELAAYAALYTYRDNTTIYNDAGAYMELEYVMDAKKYIDSLVGSSTPATGTILPATVE